MAADRNALIFAEKVKLLYSLQPLGSIATVTNCAIVTYLHWRLVPHGMLLLWAGTLFGVSLVRIVLSVSFRRAHTRLINIRRWYWLFALGMVLSGMVWGTAALFARFHTSLTYQLLVAYVLGGMAAGAAGTFASLRLNFYGFTIPALVPQILVFGLSLQPVAVAMAFMLGLFGLMLSLAAETNRRIIDRSYRLHFENRDLIQSLYREKETTESAVRLLQAARDELEQKVAQRTAALSQANAELARGEETYRSLVETAQEGIWVISPARRISYANTRMAELLGYEVGELIERDVSRFVIPDDVAFYEVESEIRRIRQVHLRTRSGRIFPALEAASPLPLPIGNAGRLLCMVTDISELKQREEQIGRYAQALEERNRELDDFTHSVSHDLRTPLVTITGFARIIKDRYAPLLPAEPNDYLQHIIDNTGKMNTIIDDLLKLSRLSRQELRTISVDLGQIAAEIIAELRKAFPGRTVQVEIQSGLVCEADPGLITVALTNLLSNAWKYTQKEPQALIEVGSCLQHGSVTFFVKDNGAGFDMEQAHRLFKPFQRLHAEKEFAGTGIGLVIVERVISKHGGRIWAESAPGNGTTFFFQLSPGK
jgi:PAS domain S-box-containing protein